MKSLQVLVVDDEPAIRQVLAAQITKAGHEVDHLGDAADALARLAKGDVDVCICDIRMPEMSGIELVEKARSSGIETVFLMMTAYASVNTAIEAMKAGAFDYMIKPLRHEDVLRRLGQVADFIGLREENVRLRSMVRTAGDDRCILPSMAMRQVDRLISKVAATEGTVLITGDSGTGKGIASRAIHQQSLRANRIFLPVNCGAIPENLLESELFGHLKGAFTGADRAQKGLFREADGGTLFLDEICELPLSMQVKLLHVLEDKEIRPVGSEQPKRVDVRILAATNRDVEAMVASGDFREDLYYRLNVLHISLPPLRERREDIAPLIHYFLRREASRLGLAREYTMDPVAEDILVAYKWPGNVRELHNVIERALILSDGDVITVADLPPQVTRTQATVNNGDKQSGNLRERVRQFEFNVIQQAIEDAGGDRQAAARGLGIGLSTLYRKLEESERARG